MTYKNIYIFSGFSKTVIGWWVWLKELGWQLAVFNLLRSETSLSLSGPPWLSVTPTLALTGSHCHSLAHSGSLLLSNLAYTVLDRLSEPSQRCSHVDALSPALNRGVWGQNYSNHAVIDKAFFILELPKYAILRSLNLLWKQHARGELLFYLLLRVEWREVVCWLGIKHRLEVVAPQ